MVDTGVGNYLLQAARAARLLGSRVVLVGISAEIAQTIVQLGVDLSDITTHADLQAGIDYALGTLGLEIRPV
jgi:rsbT co-antagonist protein RsbR